MAQRQLPGRLDVSIRSLPEHYILGALHLPHVSRQRRLRLKSLAAAPSPVQQRLSIQPLDGVIAAVGARHTRSSASVGWLACGAALALC